MSPKSPDSLETCAFKYCNALIYRSEAVKADQVPGRSRGWFCTKCARVLGWRTPQELADMRREAASRSAMGDDITLNRFIARKHDLEAIQEFPGLD
jgi:hypothetical protein